MHRVIVAAKTIPDMRARRLRVRFARRPGDDFLPRLTYYTPFPKTPQSQFLEGARGCRYLFVTSATTVGITYPSLYPYDRSKDAVKPLFVSYQTDGNVEHRGRAAGVEGAAAGRSGGSAPG